MIKITGLDEFSKKIDSMKKKVEEVGNTKSVPLGELLSPEFLASNTTFTSVKQLFESAGFSVETQEELDAVPQETIDAHVRAHSNYEDWASLLQAGGKAWAIRKMGFGK
jgi:hypothetical protein